MHQTLYFFSFPEVSDECDFDDKYYHCSLESDFLMAKPRRRVLVIECTPKRHDRDEGSILFEFLKMTNPNLIGKTHRIRNKSELLKYLADGKVMREFDFVHLSAHGAFNIYGEPIFLLPNGYLLPTEFPDSCFRSKVVTLSVCSLCRKEFIEPLMNLTKAEYVIGPQRDVLFDDAAMWFSYFYYLVIGHRYTVWNACDRANRHLEDIARGGFAYWH